MMIVTARFDKKKAVAAVVGLGVLFALCVVLVGQKQAPEPEPVELESNADRLEYLQSMGWVLEEEPLETLQFLMPAQLEEPYLSYNELQDAQGFDLSVCCGKPVERYTYCVKNYPDRPEGVQLNLYICERQPVGGDVFCLGKDGFQRSLVYPGDQVPAKS